MQKQPKDIKLAFLEAVERETSEERRAYLDRICRENPDWRAELESLLKTHDEADDFLESPIFAPDVILNDSPLTEGPGTVIGRYKLLEKIGEGGMAVVYMAEQEKPIRRKVALKIIKLGMDTKQVIARFEAERQTLAMMDHPNIAKVLDAGATDTGRPYFVMELVKGVSITDYCDQNNLSTKERLGLFIQVCNAVQHAHQKSIIHRDIKPTNVMVTQRDGKPVPKVIDFGIAKATNQRLTEKTLFTRYAHIIGTPAYMSPEQAELSEFDVDTRSDIYSLGVLLYELLTGTTPFSEEELRKAGYVEMTRVIREQEPPCPSTRLTQMLAKSDSQRKLATGHWPLAVDLDWIVMKTLEKNRTLRYETPNAFARDIRRFLDSKPILARGPSVLYQLRKLLYRHRAQAVAALTFIVIALVLGVILSMWNQDRAQLTEAAALRDRGILSQAREYHAKGDRQVAIKQIESILDSPHTGPKAQLLYAGILADSRKYDEAISMLENLVNDRREIAGTAHSLWARILWESQSLDTKKRTQVDAHRLKAEALLPKTAEAYYLRAMTVLTIKKKLEFLDQALDLDSMHYESRRLRAFTYYASRRYDRLRDDAVVMTAIRPWDPLGHSLFAIALRAVGDDAQAIECYDTALRSMPVNDPQYVTLNEDRCETLIEMCEYERVIAEARVCLQIVPTAMRLHFHVFCALTAQGRYDAAYSQFQQAITINPSARSRLRDWSMKYVFDTLHADRSWYAVDRKPSKAVFLPMLEAEETYRHLSTKARRLIAGGFGGRWTPDGSKIGFSLGVHGYSGLAVFDPATKETELLIVPGKDTRWSPDGKHIAFVRDCDILRLNEFTTAEQKSQFRSFNDEEIWVMNADGTDPRRLARGGCPSWSLDAKHLFYQSRVDDMLYSMSIEDIDAKPEPIFASSCDHVSVSPDNSYVAYAEHGTLRMVDVASKSCVAEWDTPLRIWGGNWSPDGRELSLGGVNRVEDRTGLWIYDKQEKQAKKLLNGQITIASWRPDRKRMIFSLGPPYFEIWAADLDPNVSTIDSLGPGRTLVRHYQDMVHLYTSRIETDPDNAEHYLDRARQYHDMGEIEKFQADMDRYSSLLDTAADMGLIFGTPENLGPIVNSTDWEGVFDISSDGLELYFGSDRPGGRGDWDLWVTTRSAVAEPWQPPVNLGMPLNTLHGEGAPCISHDGLTLYFGSGRPGGVGEWDIYASTREAIEASWGDPVNLGAVINSVSDESSPSITPDGLTLYFQSKRLGGEGGVDLYVTTRSSPSNSWSPAVNLGPTVNHPGHDNFPCISDDGLRLYFSHYFPNTVELWVTTRASLADPWSLPVDLGLVAVTPRFSPDGSVMYIGSNKYSGYGAADLFQVPVLSPKLQVDSPGSMD
jgi:serine/threonine protein kinase/Tol biopolymer transport system component